MKINLKTEKYINAVRKLDNCFDIKLDNSGMEVYVYRSDKFRLTVKRIGNTVKIYCPSDSAFFRALILLKEYEFSGDFCCEEIKKLNSVGYMVDCSRNAAYTVTTVKRIIQHIALMGYDYLMLYCEDTIYNDDYPLLGYMRARYSHSEIKEIVAFGKLYGIELIPCIQTLAHLKGLVKWKKYNEMADVNDILLVDDERTYQFIESMIKTMRELYETDKIHIGMDEAFLLGRGRYMDKHGLKPQNEIFKRHINRVVDICDKYGFIRQIMWSANVKKEEIPQSVSMVFWDYYSFEKKDYLKLLDEADEYSGNIIFGDSAYKCTGIASTMRHSMNIAPAALAACDEKGVKDVLVTAWGDSGAECTVFAPLAVLQLHAEYAYSCSIDMGNVNRRLKLTAGISAEAILDFDYCNLLPGTDLVYAVNPGTALLYQDVLSGVLDKHVSCAPDASTYLKDGILLFEEYSLKYPEFAYTFEVQKALCRVLSVKWNLGVRVTELYLNDDKEGLLDIAENIIPKLLPEIENLYCALRRQWYKEAKPCGFEVQDIRFGGLIHRLKNVAVRILNYCNGEDIKIEELEVPREFYDGRTEPDIYTDWLGNTHMNFYTDCHLYDRNVTANILSGN